MWFKLKGDARLGCCASDNCWGQPTWRLEADGVGSNYCSGCKAKITAYDPKAYEDSPKKDCPWKCMPGDPKCLCEPTV